MEGTTEFPNKEQTARKELEFQSKEQTARARLVNFVISGSKPPERNWRISEAGTSRWEDQTIPKETREMETQEQTARKELQGFRQRSKPLERD